MKLLNLYTSLLLEWVLTVSVQTPPPPTCTDYLDFKSTTQQQILKKPACLFYEVISFAPDFSLFEAAAPCCLRFTGFRSFRLDCFLCVRLQRPSGESEELHRSGLCYHVSCRPTRHNNFFSLIYTHSKTPSLRGILSGCFYLMSFSLSAQSPVAFMVV